MILGTPPRLHGLTSRPLGRSAEADVILIDGLDCERLISNSAFGIRFPKMSFPSHFLVKHNMARTGKATVPNHYRDLGYTIVKLFIAGMRASRHILD